MRSARLYLPLAVLIALVAATWTVVARPEAIRANAYRGREAEHLLEFDPQEVDVIRLERGGEKCILRRENGIWGMTTPTNDLVPAALPELLIDFAGGLKVVDSFSAEELLADGHTLEDYGLGERAVELRFARADNEALFHLQIGSLCPWHHDGQPTLYLRVPNSPGRQQIFLVPAHAIGHLEAAGISRELAEEDLPRILAQPYERFRSGFTLPFTAVAADHIEWRGLPTPLELEHTDGRWRLKSPMATPADPLRIAALLGQLTGKPATQILARKAVPFPGPGGSFELRVHAPDTNGVPTEFTVEVSPPAPGTQGPLLVQLDGRSAILAFDSTDLAMFAPPLDELRSRKLLHFEGLAIHQITLASAPPAGPAASLPPAPPPLTLAWEGRHWSVTWLADASGEGAGGEPPVETYPANEIHVGALIGLLQTSGVLRFVTDTPSDLARFGLDRPALLLDFGLVKLSPKADPAQGAAAEPDAAATDPASPAAEPAPPSGAAPEPAAAPSPGPSAVADPDEEAPPAPAEIDRRLQLRLGRGGDGRWYGMRSDESSVFEVSRDLVAQIPLQRGYWRSTHLLELTPSQILEVQRQRRGHRDDLLRFNPITDHIQLLLGRTDATSSLRRAAADGLRRRLARLEAIAWIEPNSRQRAALESPQLTLHFTSGILELGRGLSLDLSQQDIRERRYRVLRVAGLAQPERPGQVSWIGTLDEGRSAFLLAEESVTELAADLAASSLDLPDDAPRPELDGDLPAPPPPPPPPTP